MSNMSSPQMSDMYASCSNAHTGQAVLLLLRGRSHSRPGALRAKKGGGHGTCWVWK